MSDLLPETKHSAKKVVKVELYGWSLFLFYKKCWFRKLMSHIVHHPKFDPFILTMIVVSTILLTLENPLDNPEGEKVKILEKIDLVVTSIFIAECVFKLATFGFIINGPDSYIRNPWNILDFIIVVFSV
jgi:hypothetical protein